MNGGIYHWQRIAKLASIVKMTCPASWFFASLTFSGGNYLKVPEKALFVRKIASTKLCQLRSGSLSPRGVQNVCLQVIRGLSFWEHTSFGLSYPRRRGGMQGVDLQEIHPEC